MTIVDWIAFAVLIVSFVGGTVVVGLRALDTWRAVRSFRRTAGKSLGELSRRVTELETRLASLDENARKLGDAQRRLSRSLATAGVLLSAARELQSPLGWLRAVAPRK